MAGFSDYVIRLLVDNSHLARDLQNSRNLMERFSAVGRSATDMLGRFAGAAGIAVGGIETFTTVINSNATSLNSWNDLLGTTKTSVDNFFSSLVNGDWSVWENGIMNAIRLSKEYTQALRELKTNLEIGDVHLSQDEKELNKLENIASNEGNSKAVREKAFKDFKAKGKEAVSYIEGLSKDINDKLSTMLEGKGINADKNIRQMIFDYLDTSTSSGQLLKAYEKAKDELAANKKIKEENFKNGVGSKEDMEAVKKSESLVKLFEKSNPKLVLALRLKQLFTTEEVQSLLDYTDKIIGLEDRLESAKKQVTDLGKDFDKNGNLIAKTITGGGHKFTTVAKSEPNVTLPTSMIPVKFEIPETTLKDLEDKRSAIVKQMNNATQDEYVKLKVELEEADLDIKDFKNGKYGKIKGIEATPVEIKSSTSYGSSVPADYSDSIEGLNALATSLQTVSNLTKEGATAWITYGANILTTVAAAIPAITALTVAKDQESNANIKAAATGAAASLASIPFVGPILAIAAVASVLAALMAIPKFATGGIVGGNKPFGDMNLARVNSGEMILNNHLQRNLFNLLNNGGSTGGGSNGKVEFKIAGRELVGVLKNYNNKISKVQ